MDEKREKSYERAMIVIEKIPLPELQWILKDLWDYNAIRWLDNPNANGTIGEETVIENGFTTNQIRWIEKIVSQFEGEVDKNKL